MSRKLSQRKKRNRRKKQKGRFLNRCDFAYAGRDVINQAFKNLDKTAPPLIQNLSAELNKTLEQRIKQIITQGGAKLRQIGPKLLREAIEDVYKTPFRLLGNFGKKKLAEATRKLKREFNKLRK